MCFGPFKRICHWGPFIALGIIKAVIFATVSCLSQWYPPWMSSGGTLVFLSFMTSAIGTLYFFLKAMYTGPGNLPKKWHPVDSKDQKFLQYCQMCEGYKAPRAHHCRKCNACNMKMDHHCPWINNCVGHKNHTSFTMFLLLAVVGCSQASFILIASIYRAINRNAYIFHGRRDQPIVFMTIWSLAFYMFVVGLAIGVVIAVGILLFFQLRAIIRNRTGIEDWILEKANGRRDPEGAQYIYPYGLGRWNNFKQVLNWNLTPVGDGITWNTRRDCHQYSLTIEQIEQKEEKRARSREYLITEPFSGWWFPITKGVCVCVHPPFTDETRVPLNVDDIIIVTRWRRYWLYGEKIAEDASNQNTRNPQQRKRGWFPRRCAVEIFPSPPPPEYEEEELQQLKSVRKRKSQ